MAQFNADYIMVYLISFLVVVIIHGVRIAQALERLAERLDEMDRREAWQWDNDRRERGAMPVLKPGRTGP
jgi:hypothetical protein